jgi:hypothetical protein
MLQLTNINDKGGSMSKSLIAMIREAASPARATKAMEAELTALSLSNSRLGALLTFPQTPSGSPELADLKNLIALTLRATSLYLPETQVTNLQTYPCRIRNAFPTEIPLSRYSLPETQALVKWPLLSSDEINQAANLRMQYSKGFDYGHSANCQDAWFVWYTLSNKCSNTADSPKESAPLDPAHEARDSQNQSRSNLAGAARVQSRSLTEAIDGLESTIPPARTNVRYDTLCRVIATGSRAALWQNFPDAVSAELRQRAGIGASPFKPLFIARAGEVFKTAKKLGIQL